MKSSTRATSVAEGYAYSDVKSPVRKGYQLDCPSLRASGKRFPALYPYPARRLVWSPLRASSDHCFIVGALRAQRPCQLSGHFPSQLARMSLLSFVNGHRGQNRSLWQLRRLRHVTCEMLFVKREGNFSLFVWDL